MKAPPIIDVITLKWAARSPTFKEIWKNGTIGHWLIFASAKGKQQKYVWQLQCQEQCIDHIQYCLSGLLRANFSFPTTVLEMAVYIYLELMVNFGTTSLLRLLLSQVYLREKPYLIS